jgi:Stress up-regulated Nod 19
MVNTPGKVVAMVGHLHDSGVHIAATDTTQSNQPFCDSVATYGGSPGYIDAMGMSHISAMSTCSGSPIINWHTGDNIQIDASYNSSTAQSDVMGIMLAYLTP